MLKRFLVKLQTVSMNSEILFRLLGGKVTDWHLRRGPVFKDYDWMHVIVFIYLFLWICSHKKWNSDLIKCSLKEWGRVCKYYDNVFSSESLKVLRFLLKLLESSWTVLIWSWFPRDNGIELVKIVLEIACIFTLQICVDFICRPQSRIPNAADGYTT